MGNEIITKSNNNPILYPYETIHENTILWIDDAEQLNENRNNFEAVFEFRFETILISRFDQCLELFSNKSKKFIIITSGKHLKSVLEWSTKFNQIKWILIFCDNKINYQNEIKGKVFSVDDDLEELIINFLKIIENSEIENIPNIYEKNNSKEIFCFIKPYSTSENRSIICSVLKKALDINVINYESIESFFLDDKIKQAIIIVCDVFYLPFKA